MDEFHNPINNSEGPQNSASRIICFLKWLWYAKPSTPKHDLNLLDNVELFLNSAEPSEANLNICKHFIELHRITENTSARKRLEKWARRTIQWYLIIVGVIIIAQGLKFICLSEAIFIALLTTTTVNILGLGFIILRGHFPNKDDVKDKNSPLSNKPIDSIDK
ncbi:hypothetical protein [uncultured Alistipes sp.]|jgi:hypothetical protein|uniref:hypothetical protein n=1 Tax=Alistipes sp. TaxID=1872444 RepID=UPI0025D146CD|nr:hypothetical protein [uncultured Alistipes sp.]